MNFLFFVIFQKCQILTDRVLAGCSDDRAHQDSLDEMEPQQLKSRIRQRAVVSVRRADTGRIGAARRAY